MDRGLAALCHQLDEACPNYEFFYTRERNMPALVVYKRGDKYESKNRQFIIECPDHDRDYVVTKLVLQFGR
jgi:hypothetical protein